jgi:hypothetical protein
LGAYLIRDPCDRAPRFSGRLLGYDLDGIATVDIDTAERSSLYPAIANGDRPVSLPLLSADQRQLFYVDHKRIICSLDIGTAKYKQLYSSPTCEVTDLLMTGNGVAVFTLDDPQSPATARLLKLDTRSLETALITEKNFSSQKLQRLANDMLLCGWTTHSANDSFIRHLGIVDLNKATVKEVKQLNADSFVMVSEDAKSVCEYGLENQIRVGSTESWEMHSVDSSSLPGYTRPDWLIGFAGNDEILMFREYDTMAPLGLYYFNIRTGKAGSLAPQRVLWDATFVPNSIPLAAGPTVVKK